MDKLLSQFLGQSGQARHKADPDLIERWEWDARFRGDENIKVEIAKAKRTATSLENSAKQFKHLKPEQEAAITGAAKAMRALADELTRVGAWAREFQAFCNAQRVLRDQEEARAFAQGRWGAKDDEFRLEVALIVELGTREGKLAFATWIHSNGQHVEVGAEEISCAVSGLKYGKDELSRAVHTLREAMDQRVHKWQGLRGLTVVCGWGDYEAYWSYRKALAQASNQMLQRAFNGQK